MRTIIATCVGLVALSAISVQAAPLSRSKAVPTELTISPPIELAAEGCGYGQRRTHWQDHWGRCPYPHPSAASSIGDRKSVV